MATPLGEKLTALIAANGPLGIADYMAHCLADPEYGYYATRDPLGRAGD
ncbi:MAG: class I SAM-dependent methyltransferase, partial [Hyphomicrobiales bacterium]|nr:class I SAM-dependent methyltransferase [Hyphomicrobiales bacterium]